MNPDYALGWWNLGVLELRQGLASFRAGHAALATAVRLDPSLAGNSIDFLTDEAVYRVTFDSVEEVSSGWAVGRTYAVAATVLGGVGLLSALGRFSNTFVADLWDELLSLVGMNPEKRPAWATRLTARLSASGSRLRRLLPTAVHPYVPWIVTGVVLTAVSAWTVLSQEPAAALAAMVGVGIATIAALAAHEGGHLIAMRLWGGRLVPAQWTGGVVLALLLIPVNASSGPFFAERVESAADDRLARHTRRRTIGKHRVVDCRLPLLPGASRIPAASDLASEYGGMRLHAPAQPAARRASAQGPPHYSCLAWPSRGRRRRRVYH